MCQKMKLLRKKEIPISQKRHLYGQMPVPYYFLLSYLNVYNFNNLFMFDFFSYWYISCQHEAEMHPINIGLFYLTTLGNPSIIFYS